MGFKRILTENDGYYVTLYTKILRDPRVSLKAKALFLTVMGLPSTWNFSVRGVVSILKESKDAIYSAIDELETFGYARREQERGKDGRLGEMDYLFFNSPPTEEPDRENPYPENPYAVNPPQYKNKRIEETKKEEYIPQGPDPAVEEEPAPATNLPTAKAGPAAKDPTAEIFDYWVEKMGKTSTAKLTSDRKAKIRARLKEGYTAADIKRAIDGCSASPFHMGDNLSAKTYNDIELICRNGSKLEGFMEIANGPAVKSPDSDSGINPPFAKTTWSDLQEIMSIEAENDEASAAAYADYMVYRRAADDYAAKGHVEQSEVRGYELSDAYHQRFGFIPGPF